jgi:hypothetical protein
MNVDYLFLASFPNWGIFYPKTPTNFTKGMKIYHLATLIQIGQKLPKSSLWSQDQIGNVRVRVAFSRESAESSCYVQGSILQNSISAENFFG